jgi:hypothetical protein
MSDPLDAAAETQIRRALRLKRAATNAKPKPPRGGKFQRSRQPPALGKVETLDEPPRATGPVCSAPIAGLRPRPLPAIPRDWPSDSLDSGCPGQACLGSRLLGERDAAPIPGPDIPTS